MHLWHRAASRAKLSSSDAVSDAAAAVVAFKRLDLIKVYGVYCGGCIVDGTGWPLPIPEEMWWPLYGI